MAGADLLRHGLLTASFIPPRPSRELREVTRYRDSLVRHQTALAHRSQQLIESATIQLGQGARAALGVSGKRRLWALARGATAAGKLSELAHHSMAGKRPELRRAWQGRVTAAQRWVLTELLDQYEQVAAALTRVEPRSGQEVERAPDPFVAAAVPLYWTRVRGWG